MYYFKLLSLERSVAQTQLSNTKLLEYERHAEWAKNQTECQEESKKAILSIMHEHFQEAAVERRTTYCNK